MNNNIRITFGILFLMTLVSTRPVLAATYGARITQIQERLTMAPTITGRQSAALQNVIASADRMLADRLTSLNTLLSRVQSDTRLSTDEKTTLTSNINTMISNLQSLKTKIDGDTDLATARADRKSIVTSYHVFVTFEPQLRLLTIVNNLQSTTATIQALVPQLSQLSATFKSQGNDTTTIDAAIADISTQLTAITTLLNTDASTLQSVVLTNNNYQATFTGVRQDLAKVRADFAQIRHDMTTILSGMGKFFHKPSGTPSVTPKVSPTLAPTATP